MRDTVEFKQDAAGLHPRNPEFRRTFARAHADLGRLRRDGHIGEDADPQAALPLDVTGDRTARGLDMPGGDPPRLHSLPPPTRQTDGYGQKAHVSSNPRGPPSLNT